MLHKGVVKSAHQGFLRRSAVGRGGEGRGAILVVEHKPGTDGRHNPVSRQPFHEQVQEARLRIAAGRTSMITEVPEMFDAELFRVERTGNGARWTSRPAGPLAIHAEVAA
jgi:hypothetical protein